MDVMSILLISLACSLHSSWALQCQQCFSYKSMEDCKNSQSAVECKSDQTRCKNTTVSYAVNIAFLEETITGYVRGCETEKNCKENKCDEEFGKELGASEYSACEIRCCEGNLCPKENSTESSGGRVVVVGGASSGASDLTAGRQDVLLSTMLSVLSYPVLKLMV